MKTEMRPNRNQCSHLKSVCGTDLANGERLHLSANSGGIVTLYVQKLHANLPAQLLGLDSIDRSLLSAHPIFTTLKRSEKNETG